MVYFLKSLLTYYTPRSRSPKIFRQIDPLHQFSNKVKLEARSPRTALSGNSAWVCHGNWIFFVPLRFKNLAPVQRPYLYLGHILFLTWHVHAVTGLGTRAGRRPHYLVDYDLANSKSTSMETQWVGLRENR